MQFTLHGHRARAASPWCAALPFLLVSLAVRTSGSRRTPLRLRHENRGQGDAPSLGKRIQDEDPLDLDRLLAAVRVAVLKGDHAEVGKLSLGLKTEALRRKKNSLAPTAPTGADADTHEADAEGGRVRLSAEPKKEPQKQATTGEQEDQDQAGDQGTSSAERREDPGSETGSGSALMKPSSPVEASKGSQLKGALAKPSPAATVEAATQCVLDDRVFSLTAEAKAELIAQLETPTMQDALHWVRRGGWWNCASQGELCKCAGEVRLVGEDLTTPLSTQAVNTALLPGQSILCDAKSFPGAAPGRYLSCECRKLGEAAAANSPDGFHLEKQMSSTSYLQEAWIFLLRFLGRTSLLPLGTGDRTYSGMKNWAARKAFKPGGVLERTWIQLFVREAVVPWAPGPKCLEWGNPSTPGSGFIYAPSVPQCKTTYDLQYDKVAGRPDLFHMSGNIVYSDILSLPQVMGEVKVNTIFATQVFEHINEPHLAASALFETLAPGGCVVFTAPQQAQFHQVPHDYFRFTVEGVKYTMVKAGFCVPNNGFAGGGDFVFDIARDAGLQVQDFPMEEVLGAYQRGYEKVSHSAITIHALAFKPPHASCQDPTAYTG